MSWLPPTLGPCCSPAAHTCILAVETWVHPPTAQGSRGSGDVGSDKHQHRVLIATASWGTSHCSYSTESSLTCLHPAPPGTGWHRAWHGVNPLQIFAGQMLKETNGCFWNLCFVNFSCHFSLFIQTFCQASGEFRPSLCRVSTSPTSGSVLQPSWP